MPLGSALDKSLLAYVAAASAAGVSMLALAQPAEAKIVYTKANHEIAPNATLNLDLNHDGIVDFKFSNPKSRTKFSYYRSIDKLRVTPQSKNGIMNQAAVLPVGEQVGPNRAFENSAEGMVTCMKYGNRTRTYTTIKGPWQNITDGYLGMKFLIDGKAHYGWARFNVTVTNNQEVYALLTGYAYETVANTPILTGRTKGADELGGTRLSRGDIGTATLGLLARGAASLNAGEHGALRE